MDRKFLFSNEEIKYIKELNDMKIYTGDNHNFQKNMLELKQNIFLGENEFSSLGNIFYIKDDKLNINFNNYGFFKKVSKLNISPKALSEKIYKLSSFSNKILMSPIKEDTT